MKQYENYWHQVDRLPCLEVPVSAVSYLTELKTNLFLFPEPLLTSVKTHVI